MNRWVLRAALTIMIAFSASCSVAAAGGRSVIHVPPATQTANVPFLVQAQVREECVGLDLILDAADGSESVFIMSLNEESRLYETLVPSDMVRSPELVYRFRVWHSIDPPDSSLTPEYRVQVCDQAPLPEIGDSTTAGEGPSVYAISTSRAQWFYDTDYYGNQIGGWTISITLPSPFHKTDGTSDWRIVTSQLNATRDPDLYSTPHKGLDLSAPSSTVHSIYPVYGGYTFSSGLINGGADGKYICVRHDPDSDGVFEFYSAYLHLDRLESTWQNPDGTLKSPCPIVQVSTSTKLGEVQTEAHLHLSIRDMSGYDAPQTKFWANSTSWSSRSYVDFIQKPTTSGRTVSVKAFLVTDGTGGSPSPLNNVYLWYRRYGSTGSFTQVPMVRSADGQTWTYTLGVIWSGERLQYYIGAERPSMEVGQISFRPCYYNQYKDASGVIHSDPPPIYFVSYLS